MIIESAVKDIGWRLFHFGVEIGSTGLIECFDSALGMEPPLDAPTRFLAEAERPMRRMVLVQLLQTLSSVK